MGLPRRTPEWRPLDPTEGQTGGVQRGRLRDLRWTDVKALFSDAIDGWSAHNCSRLGAALAFYTLLSLTPLLLILISIAGFVFGQRAAEAGVMERLQMMVGAQRAKIIQVIMAGAKSKAGASIATAFGAVTLLFGASGAVTELRDDMNSIWGVRPRTRTTFQSILAMGRERLWAFAFVLCMGLALTLTMMLSTAIAAATKLSASFLPHNRLLLHSGNIVFELIVLTCVFGAVFKIMPETSIKWRDVIFGAAVTAVLFMLGNLALSWYLGRASFASTYGAAASVVVLAVWVYYSAQIFFLGVELTRAFARKYGSHRDRR